VLGAMPISRVRLILQCGKETFDFVQQIAVAQNLDQFLAMDFAMALAQRALEGVIGHRRFLGGRQTERPSTPANRRLHAKRREEAVTIATPAGEIPHKGVCGEVTSGSQGLGYSLSSSETKGLQTSWLAQVPGRWEFRILRVGSSRRGAYLLVHTGNLALRLLI